VNAQTHVGRFALERELGRSDVGGVWVARDPQSLRQVAVRLLERPLPAGSPAAVEFQRIVRALLNLRHPAVVPLLEVGLHAGRPFLATALFGGGSLEHRLRTRGQLSPRRSARLVLRLAEGLGLAHREGVVHGDLTPANVLLGTDDEPALSDFGLARVSGSAHRLAGYQAPEEAAGQPPSIAGDLFGLGGVLYTCLTGLPPGGPDPSPPSDLARKVPRELDRICQRALRAAPGKRFPSADSLAAALQGFLGTPSEVQLQRRHAPAPWKTALLVLPGVIAAALVIGFVLGRQNPKVAAGDPSAVDPPPTDPPALDPPAIDPPPVVEPPPAPPASERDKEQAKQSVQRALAAMRATNFDLAVSLVDQALELWPDSPDAVRWRGLRGHGYFESKRFALAEEDLRFYLEHYPQQAYPTFQHGICSFAIGEIETSLRDFDRALELDPNLHAAHYWRGSVQYARGDDPQRAAAEIELFLERQQSPHPDLEPAREALAKIRKEHPQ